MSPETRIGVLGLMVLALFGCWRFFRWFGGGETTPNPWDEKTEESVHQPDATPLCSRCLEPHQPEAQYCPNCGVPVDPLVPYSPYFYMFAFGEMLSGGRPRGFRANWITITGFLLLPLAFLPFLLAFAYWFFFLRNLQRQQTFAKTAGTKDEVEREDNPSN